MYHIISNDAIACNSARHCALKWLPEHRHVIFRSVMYGPHIRLHAKMLCLFFLSAVERFLYTAAIGIPDSEFHRFSGSACPQDCRWSIIGQTLVLSLVREGWGRGSVVDRERRRNLPRSSSYRVPYRDRVLIGRAPVTAWSASCISRPVNRILVTGSRILWPSFHQHNFVQKAWNSQAASPNSKIERQSKVLHKSVYFPVTSDYWSRQCFRQQQRRHFVSAWQSG